MAKDLKARIQERSAQTAPPASESAVPAGSPESAEHTSALTEQPSPTETNGEPAPPPAPTKGVKPAAKGGRPGKGCPITREEFRDHAEPLVVKIGDRQLVVDTKEFSSGGLGWFCNEKITAEVNGKPVRVQCNMNLSIIDSKLLPRDAE